MKKLQKALGKIAQKVIDMAMGNGLMQEETCASGERYITPGMPQILRQAGAESCVLLKNDGTLPISEGSEVAVFGRCQLDWFYVGYGSGGDVNAPYEVDLIQGLENAGVRLNRKVLDTYRSWRKKPENEADHGWWGHWPMSHPEMPLDAALASEAAKTSDTAFVVIGRAAGEDRENTLTEGSYYLTSEEKKMLDAVCGAFKKVAVLMNIGNIMDFSWMEEYGDRISALMIVWQEGMESGNAAADVLTGKTSPSGKLADTIARRYEDYPSSANFGGAEFNEYKEGIYVGYRYFDKHPEKVLYPFGFGLSYTGFAVSSPSVAREGNAFKASLTVMNTGSCTGKEAVLLWCEAPQGSLDKPVRVLAAFGKTKELAPGESQTLELCFDDRCVASYDEERSAFVLEPGEYRFFANGTAAGSITIDAETVVEKCVPLCKNSAELKVRILENMPKEQAAKPGRFEDILAGKLSAEEFAAGLANEELEALSRGHGMMGSSYGVAGNAGAFGGITESLQNKGVPAIITSDGPAGLRLKKYCSLLPCGTALACSFDTGLVRKVYSKVGEEMVHYGVDVLLAPGMNIHRNPLCGRNFEYFSEDPLLSGKMAAAVIKGVQSSGKAACPKHYACNNQETKRNTNDSRVSERALREIYLRNFEIAVREAKPLCIMTSYNKVNGFWSHYNYDLVTTVLRGQWGYGGCVITDWWMRKSKSPEFPSLRDNAYRVRAQVDVLMPGDMGHMTKKYKSDGTLLKTLGQPEGITKGELVRTAANVIELAAKLHKGNAQKA